MRVPLVRNFPLLVFLFLTGLTICTESLFAQALDLKVSSLPSSSIHLANLVILHPEDFAKISINSGIKPRILNTLEFEEFTKSGVCPNGSKVYIQIKGKVFSAIILEPAVENLLLTPTLEVPIEQKQSSTLVDKNKLQKPSASVFRELFGSRNEETKVKVLPQLPPPALVTITPQEKSKMTKPSSILGSIQIGKLIREFIQADLASRVSVDMFLEPALSVDHIELTVSPISKISRTIPLHIKDIENKFKEQFLSKNGESDFIFTSGQGVLLDLFDHYYLLQVNLPSSVAHLGPFKIALETELEVESNSNFIQLLGQRPRLFKNNVTFSELGIGGMDTQIETLIRDVFLSRLISPEKRRTLGIKPNKGIILYGPPGTGKTLIARQISKKLLGGVEPKIINGPELFNRFVGASEENLRKIFSEAMEDQKAHGDQAQLHVFVFDEMDALFKRRGSTGDNTGVGDKLVNQFLTIIDGVDSLDNILIIGMTNRLDLLDDALLRPGRFDVRIEVGLPDLEGRAEILGIHTKALKESSQLSEDVSLEILAQQTKNYTGAELAGLVRKAVNYGISDLVDLTDPDQLLKVDLNSEKIVVNNQHFQKALGSMKPAFGQSDFEIRNQLYKYPSFDKNLSQLMQIVNDYNQNQEDTKSILISGSRGSGKSTLAGLICK